MFGGPELIVWLLLALGGALAVGNIAALTRPDAREEGEQPRLGRSLLMILVGLVIVVWAIASLATG